MRKSAVRALPRLHKEGVLHGDITLSNIMVETHDPKGDSVIINTAGLETGAESAKEQTAPRVVIMDFGRASFCPSREERNMEMARLRQLLLRAEGG